MPLIKGKSEKSFVKNLKTEMEHGHPQKQSLAIAYAMKRKAQRKKMADGGSAAPEPTPQPTPTPETESAQKSMRQAFGYADGGNVGVNKPVNPAHTVGAGKGESKAGDYARWGLAHEMAKNPSAASRDYAKAKKEHENTLSELKSMPSPKLKGLAEGGFVGSYQSPCHEHCVQPCEIHEQVSGYEEMPMQHERHNEMAHSEDDKMLNQQSVDMHAETSMHEEDLVDRIMMNRKKNNEGEAKFSEGGKVANSDEIEAGFDPNEFDDLHLRDDLESSYGEDDNAGDDLGNAGEDERRRDLVDRIMLKSFKQKIPRGYPGR